MAVNKHRFTPDEGEDVIWSGRPPQGFFLGYDLLLIVTLSLAVVFVLLLRPSLPVVAGAVIVSTLLGYGIIANYRARTSTEYFVTNKRAVIFRENFPDNLLSIRFDTLPDRIEVRETNAGEFLFLGGLIWNEMQIVRWPSAFRRPIPPYFHLEKDASDIQKLLESKAEEGKRGP